MSNEKISIEVDNVFLESLFGLVDQPTPSNTKLEDLQGVIEKIKEKMSTLALNMNTNMPTASAPPPVSGTPQSDYLKGGEASQRPKTILIVDDLGIITYQLEVLFKKIGFEVTISNEINDAIEKFKKQDFGYVVLDLFIPTEREGFMLLDELKKLSLLCKLNTKLVVMTASSKPEYKTNCKNRGAENYIEKTAGWQKELVEACNE